MSECNVAPLQIQSSRLLQSPYSCWVKGRHCQSKIRCDTIATLRHFMSSDDRRKDFYLSN